MKNKTIIITGAVILITTITTYFIILKLSLTSQYNNKLSTITLANKNTLRDSCRDVIIKYSSKRSEKTEYPWSSNVYLFQNKGDFREDKTLKDLENIKVYKIEIGTKEAIFYINRSPYFIALKASLDDSCSGSVILTNGLALILPEYIRNDKNDLRLN